MEIKKDLTLLSLSFFKMINFHWKRSYELHFSYGSFEEYFLYNYGHIENFFHSKFKHLHLNIEDLQYIKSEVRSLYDNHKDTFGDKLNLLLVQETTAFFYSSVFSWFNLKHTPDFKDKTLKDFLVYSFDSFEKENGCFFTDVDLALFHKGLFELYEKLNGEDFSFNEIPLAFLLPMINENIKNKNLLNEFD